MPLVKIADSTCYYRFDGQPTAPVLIFSHSLGLDHGMWDEQAADILPYLRVLRYDTRGHGASSAPAGDYAIADLGHDVLALADSCGMTRFAFCGLSLGGMIGQWLAAQAPERVTQLVLANTASKLSDPEPMEARRRAVLDGGMGAIEALVMGRFFSASVLDSPSPQVESARRTLLSTSPVGYAGCCAAIRDMDHSSLLPQIPTPTLVISGDLDVGMPWDHHAAILTRDIPGALAVRLPAAHISNLRSRVPSAPRILDFLVPARHGVARRRTGVRRAVLGSDYVDRAIARTTPFTRDFQSSSPLCLGQHLDAAGPRSPSLAACSS